MFGKKASPEASLPQGNENNQPEEKKKGIFGKLGLFASKDETQGATPAEAPDLPPAAALETAPIAPATPATATEELPELGTDTTEIAPEQAAATDASLEAPEALALDAAPVAASEPAVGTPSTPETTDFATVPTEPAVDIDPDITPPADPTPEVPAAAPAPETTGPDGLNISDTDAAMTDEALRDFEATLGVGSVDTAPIQEATPTPAPESPETPAQPGDDQTVIIEDRSTLPFVAPKSGNQPLAGQTEPDSQPEQNEQSLVSQPEQSQQPAPVATQENREVTPPPRGAVAVPERPAPADESNEQLAA